MNQHGKIKLSKTDKDTGNTDRIDGMPHHGDVSFEGAVYTLYAKNDIYNTAKTVKYFSKDEPIATFTFNSYGIGNVNVINTKTTAQISASGDTLCGLPMGQYYAKETVVPERI